MNELILILSLIVLFSLVVLFYRFFGETGLCVFVSVATVLANIEVMILVDAFGLSMTLGNVLFASTFLATDILSENCSKKSANKAVFLGVLSSFLFLIVNQSWLLYTPAEGDVAFTHIKSLFSSSPRILISSFLVYALCEKFDVFIYHKIWDRTTAKSGEKQKFLWLRNNGSTLLSQLINSVLFNFFAFFGTYDNRTLIEIIVSSYVIFIFTSLLDTPFIYLSRKAKIAREKPGAKVIC